ncbi:MAG: deoxyribose-phosphate aldolase [Coprococcus sp.]
MEKKEILHYVDHTLLTQTATWAELQAICDDAIRYETASVCIPPDRVKQVKEYVCGRMAVCTVIGFPNGYHSPAVKAFETEEALDNGADEIDMVINLGMVREKRFHDVETEIRTLKDICDDKILKVIVETCFLTEEEKIRMCEIVTNAGADYIKTSTGFGGGGATFEDVALFAKHIGPDVKIKAAGGIASFEDAEKFIELGASRLGTSRLIKLMY